MTTARGRIANAIALTSVLVWSGTADAQNLRDVPLGSRTATMGGAGVASGVDSAMPFLNPAGIAGTPNDTISVSAAAYSFVTAKVPTFFRPNGLAPRFGTPDVEEEEYSVSQLAAMPTGLAYLVHLGNEKAEVQHVLAISISVPHYEDRSLNGTLVASGPGRRLTAEEISIEKFRMAFLGPSYAIRIGDRFRFGASVFGYYSDATFDEHLLYSLNLTEGAFTGPGLVNTRQQVEAWCLGLSGVAGGQARIVDDLWAGLAIESRGVPLTGGGSLSVVRDEAGIDATRGQLAARTSATGDLDFGIARPFRFSGGLAYDRTDKLAVAADVHVHPSMSDLVSGSGSSAARTIVTGADPIEQTNAAQFKAGTKTVVNASLGGEIQPFSKIAFRAGVFTDFDAIEEESNGRKNGRLDWYGASIGVGHKTDPLGATYGFIYRHGRGTLVKDDELGPDGSQSASIDYTAHGFMVVLSATVELGAPVDAIVVKNRRRPLTTAAADGSRSRREPRAR